MDGMPEIFAYGKKEGKPGDNGPNHAFSTFFSEGPIAPQQVAFKSTFGSSSKFFLTEQSVSCIMRPIGVVSDHSRHRSRASEADHGFG
jgi:hypothetical protein